MDTVATCSTTNGNCHGLAPSFFNDITRRRRQNLASNDQATLMVDRKFQRTSTDVYAAEGSDMEETDLTDRSVRNLRLFMIVISQLTLRRWLRG